MLNALLQGILKFLGVLVSIVLLPINLLISAFFPDLSQHISAIDSFLPTLSNGVGFFSSLFPPLFRSLLFIALSTILIYYTVYWSYMAIAKIWALIQKIKMW